MAQREAAYLTYLGVPTTVIGGLGVDQDGQLKKPSHAQSVAFTKDGPVTFDATIEAKRIDIEDMSEFEVEILHLRDLIKEGGRGVVFEANQNLKDKILDFLNKKETALASMIGENEFSFQREVSSGVGPSV